MTDRRYWGAERYDAEARRLYDVGRYREALELLREGLEAHPDAVELHVSLGYAQLALEEFAWARRWFAAALELVPDHEEALVGLGDALLKLGERSRAFVAFRRVLELGYAGDPDLMLAVARALYREELYERALDYYRRAGRGPDARAEAGYTHYQLGDRRRAARCLESALEADPGHHEARVFLGNLLYDAGDCASALSHFERVPAERMEDPLAVWRTVELLRSYRELPSDHPTLQPYLDQLARLGRDPAPEDRLLAEVASRAARGEARSEVADPGQLDLFTLGAPAPEGRGPEVHTVRAGDGRVYTGDWRDIVGAMRDHAGEPDLSIAEFMRRTARRVRDLTGVEVPHDDPEAFLRATARAGLLRIEG